MFITKINLFTVNPYSYDHAYYILIQDIWIKSYRSKKLEQEGRIYLPVSARHFSDCIIDDENNVHKYRHENILSTLNNTPEFIFKDKCFDFTFKSMEEIKQAVTLINQTRYSYYERNISLQP